MLAGDQLRGSGSYGQDYPKVSSEYSVLEIANSTECISALTNTNIQSSLIITTPVEGCN
jgi:hypothetical protein